MSNDHIYVRFKGRVLGPFDVARVQELVKRGQVTRMHELSSDGLSWVKATEFDQFWSTGSTPAVLRRPTGPAGDHAEEADAAPRRRENAAVDQTADWYAHIHGENRGPLRRFELDQAHQAGEISPDTLLWRAGLDDWKPAAELVPELFGSGRQDPVANIPIVDGYAERSHPAPSNLTHDHFYHLATQRFWVLFLASLLIGSGALGVVFWVVYMIVGAAPGAAMPLSGSFKVIVGLEGLACSGLLMVAGYLLARFGLTLKDMALRRDQEELLLAIKRLGAFWRFVGTVSLTMLLLILISVAAFFAIAAGAGAGAT